MILPLEKQYVSLDLAKEMKELGFRQDTEFYHRPTPSGYVITRHDEDTIEECDIAAYTVAELGEILPNWYASYRVNIDTPPLRGKIGIWRTEGGNPERKESGDTEANSKASMCIYLEKNNLLSGAKG